MNELIGILKDRVILASSENSPAKQAELMNEILDEAKRFVVSICYDRSVKRNPHPRTSDFHHNQKVIVDGTALTC